MASSISLSNSPDDIWMVQNGLFRSFMELVAEHFRDDSEMLHKIEMAIIFQGISLDHFYSENPQRAIALREAILAVATDIIAGRIVFEEIGKEDDSFQDAIRSRFTELVALLSNAGWPGQNWPGGEATR